LIDLMDWTHSHQGIVIWQPNNYLKSCTNQLRRLLIQRVTCSS